MRIRTGPVILGLLVLIICTANLGQAAESYKYNIHDLAPPNEHPWQHEGSPENLDNLGSSPVCSFIWPLSSAVRAVFFIWAPAGIEGHGVRAQDASRFLENQRDSDGGR